MIGFKINNLNHISSAQLVQLGREARVYLGPRVGQRRKRARDQQYWAESIEDTRLNTEHELLFLVKWENYAHASNTWQSVQDLQSCDLLFADYHARQFSDVINFSSEDLKRLSLALPFNDSALVSRLGANSRAEIWSLALKRARKVTNEWYSRILVRECLRDLQIELQFKSLALFSDFCEKRRETVKRLKQWEREVNAQLREEPNISLANNWDLEVPPPLHYLSRPLLAPNLALHSQLKVLSCKCQGHCGGNRQCVCALSFRTEERRFKTSRVIYECHDACSCARDACPNRRIQRGRANELQVFRTRDRGWGLRTLNRISFGDFVMEYVGEVIDSHATRLRDSTYFFNIDKEFCGQTLFVDGKDSGNITRFANHSCEPNLDVHLAFVAGVDKVPRIAFFANRRIEKNEELTYDYAVNVLNKDETTGEWVRDDDSGYDSRESLRSQHNCLCGSKKCAQIVAFKL